VGEAMQLVAEGEWRAGRRSSSVGSSPQIIAQDIGCPSRNPAFADDSRID